MLLIVMMVLIMGSAVTVMAEEEPKMATNITARFSGSVKPNTELDNERFTVIAYYSDGTNRELDETEFTVSPAKLEDIGNNMVTVSYKYEGLILTTECTVPVRTTCNLSKIVAEYKGGAVFVGDAIERGDVKVMAYYGDGTSAEVYNWYFANYVIANGNNVVYLVYEEDGFIRNCSIRVPGQITSDKELIKITASYIGDGVNISGTIKRSDVQVSAYFKYMTSTNDVGTSMEGVTDWWFENYYISRGTNEIIVYYKYGDIVVSDKIKVEGLEYEGNWVVVNGSNKFQTNDGNYLVDEWYEENGIFYHFDDGGNLDIGLEEIDGYTYYFDEWGRMATDWVSIRNTWYHFGSNGRMSKGWVKDGLYWYYMNTSTGEMLESEWVQYRGRWYYLSMTGIMATGWFMDEGIWYYLTPSGAMATDWYKVGDKWYYGYKNGALATNTWIDNYYVDANGVWTQTR